MKAQSQGSQFISITAESKVVIAGDIIRFQVLSAENETFQKDKLIYMDMVDSEGNIVLTRKLLTTNLDKSFAFKSPANLSTGNYKLVFLKKGVDFFTEVELYIYNSKIFNLSMVPDNAKSDQSIDEQLISLTQSIQISGVKSKYSAGDKISFNTKLISSDEDKKIYWLAKVYSKDYETTVVSASTTTGKKLLLDEDLNFGLITDNPNSRLSVYFVDQMIVEEGYLANIDALKSSLNRYYGDSKIWIYQFDEKGNRLGEVKWEKTGSQRAYDSFDNQIPYDSAVFTILQKKRDRKLVQQSYGLDYMNVEKLESNERPEPDHSIVLSNYNAIVTLKEAINSVVPQSKVIKKNGNNEIRLTPNQSSFRYDYPPLVLINGVPNYSPGPIFDLKVSEVEKVEVFNSKRSIRSFGTLGLNGVLSIVLRENIENPLQSTYEGLLTYNGLSNLMPTDSETYIGKPDLRATLLWETNVAGNSNQTYSFSYNQNHVNGAYLIYIQAITESGEVYKSAKEYIVGRETY